MGCHDLWEVAEDNLFSVVMILFIQVAKKVHET
jgi:hypothetical protein